MLTTPEDGVPVLRTRSGRLRSIIFPLIIVLIVGLIGAWYFGRGEQAQINGAGSTLAQPLIERSAIAFRDARAADNPSLREQTGSDWVLDGSGVTYEPVGSVGGIVRLDDPGYDFAISDFPVTADVLAAKNIAQFPIAIGGLAIVYNLDLPGGTALQLDAPVLAGIYLGEVTRWNDPAIAALNPGVSLPGEAIVPVHRTDGSGSTAAFSTYLAAGSPAWQSDPGTGTQLAWPTGTGVERSGGMLEAVTATAGSIGYVEQGQASRAGIKIAALGNAAGGFTTPTREAMLRAAAGHDWSGNDDYVNPLRAADDDEGYPLTVPVYAMVKRAPAYQQDTVRTISYLRFVIDEYDDEAGGLGYLPLPGPAAEAVLAYWNTRLTGATP